MSDKEDQNGQGKGCFDIEEDKAGVFANQQDQNRIEDSSAGVDKRVCNQDQAELGYLAQLRLKEARMPGLLVFCSVWLGCSAIFKGCSVRSLRKAGVSSCMMRREAKKVPALRKARFW